ncbi:solute carrier family 35 member G1-like [Stegodyphus dumicola]|uniref:solute carrier family 35 member G1-like n=1 Tax=Stegodyphus dumicola TaxID=202533 RepID=UPI0015A8C55D|nr:solute carrier family 35 member G1-like [Stegodyphus dumicola]
MFRRKKWILKKPHTASSSSSDCIISTLSSVDILNENEGTKFCHVNYKPFLGFIYILICSLFITLSSVIVKKITYISPGQLSLVRNAGVLVGNLPIAIYSNEKIIGPKGSRLHLTIRSFLGATALYLNLMAFRYLPLAEAAIIMSTLPAMVGITARLYLKEPCGVVQAFAILLTICGMLLSIQLPELITKRDVVKFDTNYIIGLACAVGCVVLLSATFVMLREMKDVHFSVNLIFSGFIGVLENSSITAAISYYSWPRCGYDPVLVMLVGVFGFLGHCGLVLAIQTEAVSIITVMKAALDIIIAMIFQAIFFQSRPTLYNAGGALLVISCIAIIGTRKWLQQMPEEAVLRKRFKYLLL